MIAPYLQACNNIALCWIQKPSHCHINENNNQCLPQKNCITSWYHLNLRFVAKRQRTITEFRNLSAAQKKFRKVDRKSSCYFIHSKFARYETTSNTTSATRGRTIPVWWNSVKPPVTHWLKGDFEARFVPRLIIIASFPARGWFLIWKLSPNFLNMEISQVYGEVG